MGTCWLMVYMLVDCKPVANENHGNPWNIPQLWMCSFPLKNWIAHPSSFHLLNVRLPKGPWATRPHEMVSTDHCQTFRLISPNECRPNGSAPFLQVKPLVFFGKSVYPGYTLVFGVYIYLSENSKAMWGWFPSKWGLVASTKKISENGGDDPPILGAGNSNETINIIKQFASGWIGRDRNI